MAITINGGTGVITGVSVGGLPDGIVDAGTLATNSVDSDELVSGAVDSAHLASGVGGGNRIFIKQIVASNDASIDFVDGTASVVLDNTYKIYEIDIINMDNATAHQAVYGRLYQVSGDRPITGSSYTGNEDFSYTGATSGTVGHRTTTNQTEMRLGWIRYFSGSSSTTQFNTSGQIKIYNPSATGKFCHVESTLIGHSQDGTFHRIRSYYYTTDTTPNTNIDGIKIYMASGNISSGTFNLYGIKDS